MDDLDKARRAQRIMEDGLMLEIRAALHARNLDAWKHGVTVEARELAWHRERALVELEDELQSALNGGALATQRQAREESRHARRKGETL